MNLEQKTLYDKLNEKSTLREIQNYIKKQNTLRGFDEDTVMDRMLLLVEEVGELAKAVRKEKETMGVDYQKIQNYSSSREEAADVFYVLLSVCDLLDMDILEAFLEKEKENMVRTWVS